MKLTKVFLLIALTIAYVGVAKGDLLNKGVDCWDECGSTQGQCSFCGDGLCCRKTGFWWSDTSNGCDGSIGGGDYHACVAAPGAPENGCKTNGGPKANVECVFPFIYNNKRYDACTNEDNDAYWCYTMVNRQGYGEYGNWGTCENAECPIDLKGDDVSFTNEELMYTAHYDSMNFLDSVILFRKDGELYNNDDNSYKTGYVDVVIKITKNYAGPKIQYLTAAGLMQINSGAEPIEKVSFTVFGASASVQHSLCGGVTCGAQASASVVLAGGSVSIFDLQLALGVSTGFGIADDSVSVKVLGIGGSIGRKVGICVLDTCFGVDFGRLGRK